MSDMFVCIDNRKPVTMTQDRVIGENLGPAPAAVVDAENARLRVALQRIADMTPAAANARTAEDLHKTVSTIAVCALRCEEIVGQNQQQESDPLIVTDEGVLDALKKALNFINSAAGTALGIAMSTDHPNPDEVLLDLAKEGMELGNEVARIVQLTSRRLDNNANAALQPE